MQDPVKKFTRYMRQLSRQNAQYRTARLKRKKQRRVNEQSAQLLRIEK